MTSHLHLAMTTDADFVVLNPANQASSVVPAFCETSLQYTDALSQALLQDPACRNWPDLIALGFWLRRAQLTQMLSTYQQQADLCFKPLGWVFHAAPANVDSLFMYSGILSFLVGNCNLIRLSSRSGGSSLLLIAKIRSIAAEFPAQNARFCLVQSSHNAPKLSQYLAHCDGRVLWGSDEAIVALRKMPMPAYARELCFAHKFSLALLGAPAVLDATEAQLTDLLQQFSRDNLTYAQQACSSAKAICWLGTPAEVAAAQQKFWPKLSELVNRQSLLNASEHYQALANAQLLVMQNPLETSMKLQSPLLRLQTATLTADHTNLHQGCGLFVETQVAELSELNQQLTPSHQTLSHWGVPKTLLQRWFMSQLCGIDRLVPVGQALNFNPVWDGVDIISSLSRQIRL